MGLLDRLKSNKNNKDFFRILMEKGLSAKCITVDCLSTKKSYGIHPLYLGLHEWLDLLLKNELSSEIKAIIFNLYEDTDNKWSIELVGTFSFNKDNDDWA